jgi:hypothetical protein
VPYSASILQKKAAGWNLRLRTPAGQTLRTRLEGVLARVETIPAARGEPDLLH